MRLFVAVQLPDGVLEVVAGLARPDVEGLRWTTRDQWHVTLRFLGHVDDPAPVSAALRSLSSSPSTAALGPASARFGRRVLHVPVAGLDAVAGEVVTRTAAFGEPPEDRAFTGHLTLARARHRRGVDLAPLCGVAVAASWPVTEVSLVESRLHPHGARYVELERFSLAVAG